MFRNETETTGQQNITVRKYFHTQQQQQNYFFLRWISYVVHLLKHDDKQELFLRIGFVSEMIRLSLAWMSETKYMFVCLFFFSFCGVNENLEWMGNRDEREQK